MTDDPFTVHGSDAKDQFTPLEAGVYQAALACIVYNPNMPGYQGSEAVNQCIFVWVTPRVKDEGGAPKQVRMTITIPENPMHERAKFRQVIESWIGHPLTSTQVENFNMRQMLGARCTLVTTVATSAQGRKYAKVTSVARRTDDSDTLPASIVVRTPKTPGQKIVTADGVTIIESRPDEPSAKTSPSTPAPAKVPDADIPF